MVKEILYHSAMLIGMLLAIPLLFVAFLAFMECVDRFFRFIGMERLVKFSLNYYKREQ